jgi:hypothetical protein
MFAILNITASHLGGVGGREGKVVQTQARLVLFMGQLFQV